MVGEIWGLFTHSLLKAIHFPAGFSVFHHFGPCKTIRILEEFQHTEFQSSLKRHKGKYTVSPFRKKLFPRNMRFSQVTNHFQKETEHTNSWIVSLLVNKSNCIDWLTTQQWFNPSQQDFATSLGRAKTTESRRGWKSPQRIYLRMTKTVGFLCVTGF